MTSRDFCYWLQGYFEISNATKVGTVLTADQLFVIKNHLAMVFVHEIDPSFPKEQKVALDAAHFPEPTNPTVLPSVPGSMIGGTTPDGLIIRC